jgi:hypothetical protein
MIEIAIFTEEIAEELMARGFQMVGKSKLAWFFEDSKEIEVAIEEIIKFLENSIDK